MATRRDSERERDSERGGGVRDNMGYRVGEQNGDGVRVCVCVCVSTAGRETNDIREAFHE